MKTDKPNSRVETGGTSLRTPAHRSLPTPDQLAALAERLHTLRDRKSAVLGSDLIAEPGWEILIALYRAQSAAYRLTVSNAVRASDAPASTARRWLTRLEELGLVSRKKDASDGRIVFIELDAKARQALEEYFVEIWVALHEAD